MDDTVGGFFRFGRSVDEPIVKVVACFVGLEELCIDANKLAESS